MPTFPTHVTKSPGLAPLWEYWGKHLRQYYLSSCATPPTPPLQQLLFLHDKPDRANIDAHLEMLKELDRQVEVAWRTGKLKDDDRKQAAAKVLPVWEGKMKTYPYIRDNGLAGTGASVSQVGQAFRHAASKGMQSQVQLKKGNQTNKGCRVVCNAGGLVEYFRA